MSTDGPSGPKRTVAPSGGQAAPDADVMMGSVIDGRYRVTAKLGEGGMGEVYAAEHVHIHKRVAVKVLRSEILSNQEAVTRFRQEAMASSSIKHKNIIQIEDFGELEDGRIYLCMELLDGAPFNDMIDSGGLSADRLLNILIQTGHGLAAAHSRNIVHRDMKPENIFVTDGDVPKLLDFGIAKVSGADGNNHLTRTGTIFGTPFYMAPEQALGQNIDHRADIYAMGVILYEVFCGSVPFTGESFMGILTQHITAEPKAPSVMAAEQNRTVPPGVEEVILRAMKKEPDQRYQSMDELVQALVVLFRQHSGAGMSSYMQAHQPPPSYGMPSATGSPPSPPGSAIHPAQTPPPSQGYQTGSPTPMPMGPGGPGYSAPTPMPMGGPGHPSQPMAQPVGQSSGYAPAASDGYTPPKSRAGLIIGLILLVGVLGGGGAFAYFQFIAPGGSGDSNAAAAIDGGTTVAANTGDAGGSGESEADASVVAARAVDAGGTKPAATFDAAPGRIPVVTVLIASSPTRAKVYRDGKLIDKTPFNLDVPRGETIEVVLKRRKYKDETVSVDGAKTKLRVSLTKIRGPRPPDPPTLPLDSCKRAENKNKLRCLPADSCKRPENKQKIRCLPRNSCKRPENKNKPRCQLE